MEVGWIPCLLGQPFIMCHNLFITFGFCKPFLKIDVLLPHEPNNEAINGVISSHGRGTNSFKILKLLYLKDRIS